MHFQNIPLLAVLSNFGVLSIPTPYEVVQHSVLLFVHSRTMRLQFAPYKRMVKTMIQP